MDFTNFFCFRLGAISRKMTRYYNKILEAYGITISQAWVLFYLINLESSNLKDMAAALQLESPVVTGIVDRLVKEGLVTREEDPQDRRSLKISLTDKGRAVVKEVSPVVGEYNQKIKNIIARETNPGGFEKALAALEKEL